MSCKCEPTGVQPGVCDHCIGIEQGRGDTWMIAMMLFVVLGIMYLYWRGPAAAEPA